MNYVSILFAFLIAGYFVAERLKPPMIALVIFLFTAVALYIILQLWAIEGAMGVLSTEMALRVANDGFDLPDLEMARGGSAFKFYITEGIATIGGYIAALIFFFHQRHQGLKSS